VVAVDLAEDVGGFASVGVAEENAAGSQAGAGVPEIRDKFGAGVEVADGEVADEEDVDGVGGGWSGGGALLTSATTRVTRGWSGRRMRTARSRSVATAWWSGLASAQR